MNDRSYLLKRRRCNILKQRKKKPVSCRHQFVHDYSYRVHEVKKAVPVIEEKYIAEEDTVSAQPVINTVSDVKETPSEVKSAEHNEPVPPAETAEKKLTRKEKKKQEKEEIINLLIDEPEISIFKMLTNPLLCMDQVSELDYATLSSGQCFVLNAFKWLAIGVCFALPIMKIIDINPYGFSRLNFTSTSIVAFEIAIYGFVCEFLTISGISLLCVSKNKPVDRKRTVAICAYGAPLEIVLFVISAILMDVQLTIGIAFFIASVITALFLKAYGIAKADLAKKRLVFGLLIFGFIFTVLFFVYASFFGSNVIKIFKNIMNL